MQTPNPSRSSPTEACFSQPVVAYIVHYTESDPEPPVAPELAPLIECAVPSRRRDFTFGRACAHRALAELGFGDQVVARGPDRAPVWPNGISGSISHAEGLAIAVAAPSEGLVAIGTDVVVSGSVPADIEHLVFTGDERRKLASLADLSPSVARSIAFGAKEAFFKAQYQLTARWVDFHDVQVTYLDHGSASGPGRLELAPAPDSRVSRDIEWPVQASWVGVGRHVVVGTTTKGVHRFRRQTDRHPSIR